MRYSTLFVLIATVFVGGCFSSSKPIAGKVEESFKTRWVAKRMAELQANGTAPDPRDARAVAVDEFKKKYEYTAVAKKPDPVTGNTK